MNRLITIAVTIKEDIENGKITINTAREKLGLKAIENNSANTKLIILNACFKND